MRLVVALLSVLLATPFVAAQIVVTALDDELNADGDCSLREAIEAALTDADVDACAAGEAGADTITFEESVPAGTLGLTLGEIVVTDDLSIDGRVADGTITLSGLESSRIFRLDGGTTTLASLTLVGGQASSGGAVYVGPDATLVTGADVIIDGNAATGASPTDGGGGLFIDGGAVVVLDLLRIRENTAVGSGGGIRMRGGSLRTDGGEIGAEENESGADGGALALTDGAEVDLDAFFRSNVAGRDGGAVHTSGETRVTLRSGGAFQNQAGDRGGAFWNGPASTLAITGNATTLNEAAGGGGGALYNEGTVDLDGVLLDRNVASGAEGDGGGLLSVGGTVTLANLGVRDNQARGRGAGLAVLGATTRLVSVSSERNGGGLSEAPDAPVAGGGLYASGGTLEVIGSGFVDNEAQQGGGLWVDGSVVLGPGEVNGISIDNNLAQTGAGLFAATGADVAVRRGAIGTNTASADGGGVYLAADATLTLTESAVSFNTAVGAGGGIAMDGGRLVMTDVNIQENRLSEAGEEPSRGGGLYSLGGTVEIERGTVANNLAAQGGGIWTNGVLRITQRDASAQTAIVGNQAVGVGEAGGGGGLYGAAGASVDAEAALIGANRTGGSGGGLFLEDGTDTDLRRALVQGNAAAVAGAGIAVLGDDFSSDAGPQLTLTESTVETNGAGEPDGMPAQGGGLHLVGSGEITIDRSTVSGNASGEGGGLWIRGENLSVWVLNSTVSGNRADGDGGGVYSGFTLNIAFRSATLASNTAGGIGGGLYQSGGAEMVVLRNTAIGRNEAPTGPDCATVAASIGTDGHNAIETSDGCAIEPADTDLLDVPLLLAALVDNGGPTRTHRPRDGSPLIDAGDSTFETDQRGARRDVPEAGQADIGAVETNGRPVTVSEPPAPRAPLALGPPAPNPASGRVTLAVEADGPAVVEVFDVLGKRVRRVAVSGGAASVALDVSGLAAGVYLVRLRTEAGQATRRLTVVR